MAKSIWEKRDAEAEAERDGVWVLAARDASWKFHITRLSDWNADYQRATVRIAQDPQVADYLKRSKDANYVSTPQDAALDKVILLRAFAEGCLRDWDGVTGRDGELLPFTPMNVLQVLVHFPDIATQLRTAAVNPATFGGSVPVQGELALGNSRRASNSSAASGATH